MVIMQGIFDSSFSLIPAIRKVKNMVIMQGIFDSSFALIPAIRKRKSKKINA